MKSILILGVNIVAILYFIFFFVDNELLPQGTIPKIRNILFIFLLVYLSYNVLYIYILRKEKAENGLLYQTASITKKGMAAVYSHIRSFQKELVTWTLIAAGIAFVSCLLLGLPGALLLEIPERLGITRSIVIEGDNSWPAALCLSILWPFLLPLGVVVKQYLIRAGYATYATYGWIGTVVVGLVFLVGLMYGLFGRTR